MNLLNFRIIVEIFRHYICFGALTYLFLKKRIRRFYCPEIVDCSILHHNLRRFDVQIIKYLDQIYFLDQHNFIISFFDNCLNACKILKFLGSLTRIYFFKLAQQHQSKRFLHQGLKIVSPGRF